MPPREPDAEPEPIDDVRAGLDHVSEPPARPVAPQIVSTPRERERAERAGTLPTKHEALQARHSAKKLSQYEHMDLEYRTAQKNLSRCERYWVMMDQFLIPEIKRNTRKGACAACGAETVVEMVDIYPAKVKIKDVLQVEKESLDRIRLALGMPKSIQAFRVRGSNHEMQAAVDRINSTFIHAFRECIRDGLMTEDAANAVWDAVNRIHDGRKGET